MEKFLMELPLTAEYLTTVRLTTGGLCALVGFDVDEAEDYKVCVTESLLILKRNGFTRASIAFSVGEELAFRVSGTEKLGKKEDSIEDEISKALLAALVGDVEFVKDNDGAVLTIAFAG